MSKLSPHLHSLEAESIHIIREAVAQFNNPGILFSGGKDSIVLVHLAIRAFAPAPLPFKLLHVDTGHNFPETINFRDKFVEQYNLKLDVAKVQDAIDSGKVEEETGFHASRNALQTVSLLDGINEHKFDACLGGARRDEEKSRAKERVFSVRDSFGQWDPKNQRPELWHHLNGHIFPGENVRIFPLSNWTELDIWNYIHDREIELPSLYFAHEREVFERDGHLLSKCEYIPLKPEEKVEKRMVRMRTIGDMTCTAAVLSDAVELNDVIAEISSASISERGARVDDQRSDAAMEKRKRGGYF